MRSPKTTIAGYITSAMGLILALHAAGIQMPAWIVATAGFIMAGGIAGLGRAAKDDTAEPPAK